MNDSISPYLSDLKRRIVEGRGRISEVSGKRAEGLLKRRIFNRGEATDGTTIGNYSPAYAAYRLRKSRQVEYVDFQLTGDLFRSIELGRSGTRATLGFSNPSKEIIAGKLEERFRKSVFSLSEDERKQAAISAARELGQIIREWATANP